MATDDGGPAFPCDAAGIELGLPCQPGMSLRDWFAGMAMQGGIIVCNEERDYSEESKVAYKQADAMLAEREKRDGK
jgi:hypothetical protein